ncbi:uncharacterized protein LOC133131644 isoform X1 [Conger conger]|uniref:uncharacterized protein LOC133131644 isoform X1 n=1 Tax=Conger conger TaxID=82655 RepID=UPI002A5AD927|nr:uncharacterized protein LOC133131644 isoform X1 [Conger conger]XP_061103017.1 uncharacterized protein LOC133131644 isoform X1 [Conger conger]
MKNSVKLTAKKIVEETVAYGIEKAENEMINKIVEEIEKAVARGLLNEVQSNMEKDPLLSSTNSIVLSHAENTTEFNELMKDHIMKSQLLSIFTEISTGALEPYSADLSWQNQLSSSIFNVVDAVKDDAKGKTKMILNAIKAAHMAALASDAVASVIKLASTYFEGLDKGLEQFLKKKNVQKAVKQSDLSDSDNEILKNFRQEIAKSVSDLLASTLVQVFHQKFSSHLVSLAQSKINDAIGEHVSSGLKTEDSENQISDAQDSLYEKHMPKDEKTKDHAEKVKNSETTGSNVDINVLSEVTGTKVVILTEGKDGKLTKLQEMSPNNDDASETVTLVYRPKSDEHPDGHYDVLINDQTVSVEKGDLYSAMAHGMKPDASKEEISDAADDLRAKEAEALEEKPALWQSFIQREEWIEELIVGSWGLAQGVSSSEESATLKDKIMNIVQQESQSAADSKLWLAKAKSIEITGIIINGDNQPPKNTVMTAEHFQLNSKLTNAMFEVATDFSMHATCKLPVVYAPYERYNKFPTVQSANLSKLLAETMSRDDVEGTFKLTILGSMPTFMLLKKYLQNEEMSVTRLDSFEQSFPKHATELVNTWFKLLKSKTDIIKPHNKQRLEHWINTKRYLDPNDPFRKLLTSSM